MTDIKLTLSQNKRLRSDSIDDEAKWMNEEGPIFYELHREPKTAKVGCWVYFVRAGELVARAKAEDFIKQNGDEELYTYKGVEQQKNSWCVKCSLMKVLPEPLRIQTESGFQGFRNVAGQEQAQFAKAFDAGESENYLSTDAESK